MMIKEISDGIWELELHEGKISVNLNTKTMEYLKRNFRVLKREEQFVIKRVWKFKGQISAEDLLLVVLKSLHL